jgi:hypothetical protein
MGLLLYYATDRHQEPHETCKRSCSKSGPEHAPTSKRIRTLLIAGWLAGSGLVRVVIVARSVYVGCVSELVSDEAIY